MKIRNFVVSLLALLLVAVPAGSALAEPQDSPINSELYERYPENISEVSEALTAGQEYLNYSSQAWDALVEAEAAEATAQLAVQAAEVSSQRQEESEQLAQEKEEEARDKEEEATQAAQEALNAFNMQKRNQMGGGMFPPEMAAMAMGPDSLDDYNRNLRNMQRIQDVSTWKAEAAEKARVEADEALAAALEAKEQADAAALEATLALESAERARSDADAKKEESETLLEAAEGRQNSANITLTSLDIEKHGSSNLASAEVARRETVSEWWDTNKEEESKKARGSEAVVQKIDEVKEEVQQETQTQEEVSNESRSFLPEFIVGHKTEDEGASRGSQRTEPTPMQEASEKVREEAAEEEDILSELQQNAQQRADEAVNALGTSSRDLKCTSFISDAYNVEEETTLGQLSTLAKRYEVKDARLGDIIFYEAPDGSLGQAGVYIGGGTVVVSSDPAGVVTTESAITGSFASRPGVPPEEAYESPGSSSRWECGGIPRRSLNTDARWSLPFDEYELGRKFEKGTHEAIEFIRKGEEDAVYSPYHGTVSVLDDGTVVIASESITISLVGLDKNDVFISTGSSVEKGQAVATGDKVVVKSTISGESINPEILFFPSWGITHMNEASGENQFGKPKYRDVPPSVSSGVMPVDLSGPASKTSEWGPRVPPVAGADSFHRGTDFGAPVGTPIYSVLDGVVWATFSDQYSGNQIVVQYRFNGQDYAVIYKHMSSAADKYFSEGDIVMAGDVIGEIGSTGRFSTGPHLHFEVWEGVFNRDHHVNSSDFLRMIGAW